MPQVNVTLTDDARRGWDRACTTGGVTLTALVESIGRGLLDHPSLLPDGIIDLARQIDFERRSRR